MSIYLFELFILYTVFSSVNNNDYEYFHSLNNLFIFNTFICFLGHNKIQYIINKIYIDPKIQESMYSLLYNIAITIYTYDYLYDKSWFYNITDIVDNYIYTRPDHIFSHQVQIIYVIQTSHYLLEIYNSIYNKKLQKKDDNQMMIHHIITLIMILGSYKYNYIRIGLYVMFLHHINDIILHLSKLMVYFKYNQIITSIYFGLFMISWIYTRLYLFSIFTYNLTLYYTFTINKTILTGCIYILQCLNIYWFILILKVANNIIFGIKLRDIRE